jgi:hypothetical protein
LKNRWGWLGFTAHDHARGGRMPMFVALVDHWRSLLARLPTPNRRAEAITLRPLLPHAILHAAAARIPAAMQAVAGLPGHIRSNGEQWKPAGRWRLMLHSAVRTSPLTQALIPPGQMPSGLTEGE